jgi:hypothetical protein
MEGKESKQKICIRFTVSSTTGLLSNTPSLLQENL